MYLVIEKPGFRDLKVIIEKGVVEEARFIAKIWHSKLEHSNGRHFES